MEGIVVQQQLKKAKVLTIVKPPFYPLTSTFGCKPPVVVFSDMHLRLILTETQTITCGETNNEFNSTLL